MIKSPPEWFTVRAAQPSLWSTDVCVSAEGLEWMARLWASPVTNRIMRHLWAAFLSSEAHFRERLPAAQWGRFTHWQLIQFCHVGDGVAQGIADCTPDLRDLPRDAKAGIYFHAIILASVRYACENGVPSEIYDGEGKLPAVRWAVMKALSGAVCYAMAPLGAAELCRRGSEHVGYGAAQLELLRRAEHLSPIFGDEATVAPHGRLMRSARRRVSSALRRKGLDEPLIKDFLGGLPGQATITVERKWGHIDPLELLGHALNGDLNVAPKAIQNDTVRGAEPASRQRQFEVSFQPRRTPSATRGEPAEMDPPDTQTLSPEAAAEYRALARRLAQDPRLIELIIAADVGSDVEAARALGVTDRTIRNYRKDLVRRLRE